MKAIVLSLLTLALASAAFADEYTPVDWIQVTEDGAIAVTVEETIYGVQWNPDGNGSLLVGPEFRTDPEGGCFEFIKTCRVGTTMEPGELCAYDDGTTSFLLVHRRDGLLCRGNVCIGANRSVGGDYEFHKSGTAYKLDTLPGTAVNLTYSVDRSLWQMREEGSEWVDVEGTKRSGQICGGLLPATPGEYRWVVDIEIEGSLGKYSSGNTTSGNALVVAGDPEAEDETAVEAVTWGFLKSRAAH